MRFLVDAQLPPALARWITTQGFEASHVFDLDVADASDREIRDLAHQRPAVVITKDEDFARRRVLAQQGPQIVWIRSGNTRRAALLARFPTVFSALVAALDSGEDLVEVLEPPELSNEPT